MAARAIRYSIRKDARVVDAPAAQRLDSRPELAAQIRSRQAPYAAHQPFREADSPEK
jgi:hypothetical protein